MFRPLLFGLLLATPSLAAPPGHLPNTDPLVLDEPLDVVMVRGIDRAALRAIERAREVRSRAFSPASLASEVEGRRLLGRKDRLAGLLGIVDERASDIALEFVTTVREDSVVARGPGYVAHRVRWPVVDGFTAEGLLLEPTSEPLGFVVAVPDCDVTPEEFAGFVPDVKSPAIPHRLASAGCRVLIPELIDRRAEWSNLGTQIRTNIPHREFVYRMGFELGRHPLGYEVQSILAAVDWQEAEARRTGQRIPVGFVGHGEGGWLALFAAALDSRIDAALVSGSFRPRDDAWQHPIWRNVFGLLNEFGDAELAGVVAPTSLVIHAADITEWNGPPQPQAGQRASAAPGRIGTADVNAVQEEFARAANYYTALGYPDEIRFTTRTRSALQAFGTMLDIDLAANGPKPPQITPDSEFQTARRRRRFDQMLSSMQTVFRASAAERQKTWGQGDRSSVERWTAFADEMREHVHSSFIGRWTPEPVAMNPRSRLVIETPDHLGYEVVLDVSEDVIAGGILLLPTDIKAGERRPVVVCQHGLEGTPMHTISMDPKNGFRAYQAYSAELAQRGYIVYAPQNPYRGGDRFRTLQRKANLVGLSLFSYIIEQHSVTLDWLRARPDVDGERIGFYGLSYGGKTAVRVPPLLNGYALSICSADFNEWIKKNVSHTDRYSYLFTGEYEIFEWDMAHVANYAELASLMAPRPFMVERGHHDGVAPDEWVAWEYAKVRQHYVALGIGDRTRIEFFDGPHRINGVGTFEFLKTHLGDPRAERAPD